MADKAEKPQTEFWNRDKMCERTKALQRLHNCPSTGTIKCANSECTKEVICAGSNSIYCWECNIDVDCDCWSCRVSGECADYVTGASRWKQIKLENTEGPARSRADLISPPQTYWESRELY